MKPEAISSFVDEAVKSEQPKVAHSSSISHHGLQPMPAFPAGVEMNPNVKDQYNVATYSSPEGSRIRLSADIDIAGAKKLVKILENRIKMIEEEESSAPGLAFVYPQV